MNTFIAVIVIFAVLVSIHEWGHLVFAKRAGILCREFAIGFGPKLFSFQRNETVYTIRAFPLGGFVRMAGEDPEMIQIKPGYEIGLKYDEQGKVNEIIVNNKSKHPDCEILQVEHIDLEHELVISGYINDEEFVSLDVDEKAFYIYDEKPTQIAPYNRQFASKSVGKRAMAIFAGPLMNFVLAVIAFIAYALIAGMPTEEAVVGDLTDDGVAIEAGLETGDRIVEIEGNPVSDWFEMTEEIQTRPDQEVTFVVERNGETFDVSMVTQVREGPDEMEQGVIGVYPPMERSVTDAILFGFTQTYETTILIIEALGMLVTGQFSLDALAGPVGIYEYTGEVVAMGLLILFQWTAILSVNLGIINLLPLPALDGGRLLFIGLEAVRGKPVDPQKEGMVHFIGFALLMLLVLAVTWNDINRLFM
ncbi:RIP metalloprotease RseP [Salisediminibacterium selenitireducens]|uniref:Zinc metalloprotease n=1 Tax=Bacillus selenitireducens (strain ATCC 700615 / DSM 15326 / MLS10) TaxID=439292 RepID=D6XU02_BACIE|nr:RIP metalloprotease RseP [Salisediminibacterium selenitireducens]ADH99288.1 membrane-associated zinc metalloprotease [[Bacillus] selenitireducens MLS10]